MMHAHPHLSPRARSVLEDVKGRCKEKSSEQEALFDCKKRELHTNKVGIIEKFNKTDKDKQSVNALQLFDEMPKRATIGLNK